MKNEDVIPFGDPLVNLKWQIVFDMKTDVDRLGNTELLKIPYLKMLSKRKGITKAQVEDAYRGIEQQYKCFEFSHCGTENCQIENVDIGLLEDCYSDTKKMLNKANTRICGALELNLKDAQATYKTRTVALPLNENFVGLLVFLMENPDKLKAYKDIAKALNLNMYSEDEENGFFAAYVQNFKVRLFAYLRAKLKIPAKILNNSFENVKDHGYRLIPKNLK